MPGCHVGAVKAARERRLSSLPPQLPETPVSSRFDALAQPVVDSGYNVRKLEAQVDACGRVHSRFRKDEPFRRLSCALLARILNEPGSDDALLLDLRPRELWESCRALQSRSYPAPLLYREHNEFDSSIVSYRNRADSGRIIVLLDDDETLAVPAARRFWEKGVENAFVLTGGMREWLRVAGAEMCEGHGALSAAALLSPRIAPPRMSDASVRALARAGRPASAVAGGRRPSSGSWSGSSLGGAEAFAGSRPLWR